MGWYALLVELAIPRIIFKHDSGINLHLFLPLIGLFLFLLNYLQFVLSFFYKNFL
jgi:hypothetical protein